MASLTAIKTDFPYFSTDFASGRAPSPWHKSAPGRLRDAQKAARAEKVWSLWSAHLARRKRPGRLDRLFSTRREPLLWALPQRAEDQGTPELVARLAALQRGGATAQGTWEEEASLWMAEAAAGHDVSYSLEAVAWARALPELAGVLSSASWWGLLGHLAAASVEAAEWSVEESPLVHQLLAGELALTLAYAFPEITACRKLAADGRRSLSAGMIELLDGEGLPSADHMPLLRPLLACWTRCQALGRRWKKGCFTRSADAQFEWAVRQALRWTRADGSQVFSEPAADARSTDWLAAALAFDGDEDDQDVATLVLPGSKKSERDRVSRYALPEAASNSDWSRAAVLRCDWSHCGPCLSILYPGKTVLAELSARRELLGSGRWEWEVRLDGRPLAPAGEWEETCWISDEDADFLELEIELTGGVRLQRQMVMARDDGLLLLADVILGRQPAQIAYRGCFPLREGISLGGVPEMREAYLVGRRRAALVLPLALPEWQCDRRLGTLERTGAGLELHQKSQGSSMYCPLLVDFDSRRMGRPRCWRRLTVAAELETQPADVAVGYRVQLGRDQWLIYRSLAERANRTLLGHNLSSEMLVARFDETGEVEPLVEVE